MSDLLFILALSLPPAVVVLGFAALLLPVRSVTHESAKAPLRPEPSNPKAGTPAHVARLLAHPLSH